MQQFLSFAVTFGSEAAYFDQDAYTQQLAALLNVSASAIRLELTPGSVVVSATILMASEAVATTTAGVVESTFANTTAASAMFGVPVTGFTKPRIVMVVTPAPNSPPSPEPAEPPPAIPPPLAPSNSTGNGTDTDGLATPSGELGAVWAAIAVVGVLAAVGWLGCLVVLYRLRQSTRRIKIAPDGPYSVASPPPLATPSHRAAAGDLAAPPRTPESSGGMAQLALSFTAPAAARAPPRLSEGLAEDANAPSTAPADEEAPSVDLADGEGAAGGGALGADEASDRVPAPADSRSPAQSPRQAKRVETAIEQARRESTRERQAQLQRGWARWIGLRGVLERTRIHQEKEAKVRRAIKQIRCIRALDQWLSVHVPSQAARARLARRSWQATKVLRYRYLSSAWNRWRAQYEGAKGVLRVEWLVTSRWRRFRLSSSFQAWLAVAGTVLELNPAERRRLHSDFRRTRGRGLEEAERTRGRGLEEAERSVRRPTRRAAPSPPPQQADGETDGDTDGGDAGGGAGGGVGTSCQASGDASGSARDVTAVEASVEASVEALETSRAPSPEVAHSPARRQQKATSPTADSYEDDERRPPHASSPGGVAEIGSGCWALPPPESPLHYLQGRIPMQGLGAYRPAPVMRSASGHKLTVPQPPRPAPQLPQDAERRAAALPRLATGVPAYVAGPGGSPGARPTTR